LNPAIYLLAEISTSILSLGLGKCGINQCGKSEILNFIFNKSFQTNDNTPYSTRTIDIDFDMQYRPTRRLSIADVHGPFEEIHYKPLF